MLLNSNYFTPCFSFPNRSTCGSTYPHHEHSTCLSLYLFTADICPVEVERISSGNTGQSAHYNYYSDGGQFSIANPNIYSVIELKSEREHYIQDILE